MPKTILLAPLLTVAVAALAGAPGSAQSFLDRANRLKSKGPLAFFDNDYGRLKAEATAVGKSIGDDRVAAERSGRPILYCSPNVRAPLGSLEFIDGLEAIPSAERARMSLKDAMLRVIQKKYPCRRYSKAPRVTSRLPNSAIAIKAKMLSAAVRHRAAPRPMP